MKLLEKLSSVAVNVDERISDQDRVWCETQEMAYKAARAALAKLGEMCDRFWNEQIEILSPYENSKCILTYLGTSGEFDYAKYFVTLDELPQTFIERLVNHFSSSYNVTLNTQKIKDELVLKKPADDTERSGRLAYLKAARDFELNYRQVLEKIFDQLGGLSFSDVAIKEIKDAAHKAAWNRGAAQFEQKKSVVTLSYGCFIDGFERTWHKDNPAIQMCSYMKDVIKAVSHYETGLTVAVMQRLQPLLSYDFHGKQWDVGGKKVSGIKCFSNNRVDIRFQSEAYAREFIEQYLGTVA